MWDGMLQKRLEPARGPGKVIKPSPHALPHFLELSFPLPPSGNRQRARQDLNLAILDAHRISKERPGRRSRCHRPIGIEDASMARAHEQIGTWKPTNWTSQMRAVHRKRNELVLANPPKPGCSLRRYAGPGERRRIRKRDLSRSAHWKTLGFSHGSPHLGGTAQPQKKADAWNGHDRRANRTQKNTQTA